MANINFNKHEGETLRHDEWNALGDEIQRLENKIEYSKGTKINFPNDSKKFLNGEGEFSVPTLKTINVDAEVEVVEDNEDAKVTKNETDNEITLKFSLPKGEQGETGKVYVPSVDEESGDLSWSLKNTPQEEIASTNIKGPQGDRGVGLDVNYSKSGKVTTVNITTDGTTPETLKTFQINDGADGHNPCLGRFNRYPTIPPTVDANGNPVKDGDFFYVDTENEGVITTKMYRYLNDVWEASANGIEMPNNSADLSFASSEKVVETNIVNDLTSGKNTDLANVNSLRKELFDTEETQKDPLTITKQDVLDNYNSEVTANQTIVTGCIVRGLYILTNDTNPQNLTINTTTRYTWRSTNAYRHIRISVNDTINTIQLQANNNSYCEYAFLTAADSTGEKASFASGYSKVEKIDAGNTANLIIPSDAKYLYIYAGSQSSLPNTPENITITYKPNVTYTSKINRLTNKVDAIDQTLPDINTIQQNVNTIQEWLTTKHTIITPNSTNGVWQYGWFGTNNNNWRWNRATNVNKNIGARVVEIGEGKTIDTTNYNKLSLKAASTSIGYINWHLSKNYWTEIGLAYTFLNGDFSFPAVGAYTICDASLFCEDYKPGSATSINGAPYKTIAAGNEEEVDIPADAKYLVVLITKSNQQSQTASTLTTVACGTTIIFTDEVEMDTTFPTFKDEITNRIDNISDEIGKGTELEDFYPVKEVKKKIEQARIQSYELESTPTETDGFTFIHFSDCHGGSDLNHSKEQWGKMMKYCKALYDTGVIDDVVDTGDVAQDNYSNLTITGRGIRDWRVDDDNFTQLVITLVGNHDTKYSSTEATGGTWRQHIGKDVYDQLIGPNVSNWNVIAPDNANTEGKCYFYKDYTHNGYKMRALFLDMMGWGYKRENGVETSDNSQREWVWNTLKEAISEKMVVVVFCHEVPAQFMTIPSSMSSKYTSTLNTDGNNLSSYNPKFNEVAYLIHHFMKLGGRFAGYICGHSHTSFIGRISGEVNVNESVRTLVNDNAINTEVASETTIDFTDLGNYYQQIACVVDVSRVETYRFKNKATWHDGLREKKTESEHSFWVINISTTGAISIVKIGFPLNKFYQKRDVLRLSRIYEILSDSAEYNKGRIGWYNGKLYKLLANKAKSTTIASIDKEEYKFVFDKFYTSYSNGNIVTKNGELWKFVKPVVVLAHTDWLLSEKEKYEHTSGDETAYTEFDSATIYSTNDIVSKDGELWKLTVPYVVSTYTDWAASDKVSYSRVISE